MSLIELLADATERLRQRKVAPLEAAAKLLAPAGVFLVAFEGAAPPTPEGALDFRLCCDTATVRFEGAVTQADAPALRLFVGSLEAVLGRSAEDARHRRLLLELARAGADAVEMVPLVESLLGPLLRALDADAGDLRLLEGDELVLIGRPYRKGVFPQTDFSRMERFGLADDTLSGRAARARATVAASADDWPERMRQEVKAAGLHHGLCTPLVIRDGLIGTMGVLRIEDRPFDAEDRALLETCAAQVAVALEHVRLLERERRRAHDLEVLLEVGQLLTGSLELDRILEVSAQRVAQITASTHCFITLRDRKTGALTGMMTSSPEHRDGFLGLRVPEHSLAGEVVRRRTLLVVEDAMRSPLSSPQLLARFKMKSMLALPLMVRGEVIGAVTVGDARQPRGWSAAEVARAEGVARQIAVAISNAQLFADLKNSYAELERAQAELVRTERLAALGELSAMVAHEVRNPLGVIYNSMSALSRALLTSEQQTLLGIVSEEAERIDRIVSELLDFARPLTAELRPADLKTVVDAAVDAVKRARPSLTARVAVKIEVEADLPRALVDERMLRQALVNLLMNAEQAMPRGGEIGVRLWTCERRGLRGLCLTVSDQGPGLPAEVAGRLFQPFVTSKATGAGLGLAVVKRIAEAHGGEVEAASVPSGGARFTLWVPNREPEEARG